jgi:hypothetical protein
VLEPNQLGQWKRKAKQFHFCFLIMGQFTWILQMWAGPSAKTHKSEPECFGYNIKVMSSPKKKVKVMSVSKKK